MMPSSDASKLNAINNAKRWLDDKPVYIDSETTGLEVADEIVEFSILDHDGGVLFDELVKPSRAIPPAASRIHGITNEMTATAKNWPILWPTIRNLLYGRSIAAYNAPFDLRMMQQSHARYRLPWRENLKIVDVLTLYSEFRGIWNPARGSLRYFKLEEAGSYFNVSLPNAHRSMADALLTRAVLHCIAGLPY